MDYTQTQHQITQSPQLAYRQEKAFSNFAPQADEGSYMEARMALAEWEYEQNLDGSSHEQAR